MNCFPLSTSGTNATRTMIYNDLKKSNVGHELSIIMSGQSKLPFSDCER